MDASAMLNQIFLKNGFEDGSAEGTIFIRTAFSLLTPGAIGSRLFPGTGTRRLAARAGLGGSHLAGDGAVGRGGTGFAFQGAQGGAGTFGARAFGTAALAFGCVARGLFFEFGGAAFGRAQFHAGPARFGKADGDGLFRAAGSMFAFANVFEFFAHKFAGLCARRFSLAPIFFGAPHCFSFWHSSSQSVQAYKDLRQAVEQSGNHRF